MTWNDEGKMKRNKMYSKARRFQIQYLIMNK